MILNSTITVESMLGCEALDLVSLIRTALPYMPCLLRSLLDLLALGAKTLPPLGSSHLVVVVVEVKRPSLLDMVSVSSGGQPSSGSWDQFS